MSGRVLSFKDYIGGADNVISLEMFPRTQKAFTYNFGGNDVSGYTFTADYQSILLDTVTYDRITGDPNFTDTTVAGYFDNYSSISGTNINNVEASTGIVVFTIPQNRYAGNIVPNARTDVVASVVSFQWQTDDSPAQHELHRWLCLERWEAGVDTGSPRQNTGAQPAFIALT